MGMSHFSAAWRLRGQAAERYCERRANAFHFVLHELVKPAAMLSEIVRRANRFLRAAAFIHSA